MADVQCRGDDSQGVEAVIVVTSTHLLAVPVLYMSL